MRLRYKLLKDTPEFKAGAMFEETSDNGNFKCITPEFCNPLADTSYWYNRKVVMEQPEWFEEIVPFWTTKSLLGKLEEFIKTLK